MLAMTALARMGVSALAFLLDTDELTASARFGAILTAQPFDHIKSQIIEGNGAPYRERILAAMPHVQASFHAPSAEDVHLEMQAFEQRFGQPPDAVLVDNLGNQTSAFGDEWAVLKALTLEYDQLARETQAAVIACHHTTDLESAEPAQRTKILGKISQYARLILSVGYNDLTGEYKVAAVKNTSGPSDRNALNPVVLLARPDTMQLFEPNQPPVRWEPPEVIPPEGVQRAWTFAV
jgi:hypothetical protein